MAEDTGNDGQETEAETVPADEVATETVPAEAGGTIQPGWYPDPNAPGTERYWDGSDWTDQTQSGSVSTTKRSETERKAILAQQVQMAIAAGGRVESQSEFQAVLVTGQPVNNTLHAILTIFTCLIWGIVWIVLIATGGERRQLIVVDEFGNAAVQRLGKR